MAAVKALQQWCRVQCDGYRDVSITNMTTSFRDGLAFCALIHKHRPELVNFDSLRKEDVYENNKLAFHVAERDLGIPALLDAEDMVALKVPDRLSILTYVSQYYNYFHGRSPIGGMGGIKRPAEGPAEEPSGKKNQPVAAKAFPPSKPARENSPPPSCDAPRPTPAPRHTGNATQDAAGGEMPHLSGTLSNRCVSCKQHVHLVQRHLVDGKLYHRNCAKLQAPTNSTSPLRPLPTNTPVSKWSPAPDATKTNRTWQTEKLSAPSAFASTFSTSAPSRPPTALPSPRLAPVAKPAASQAEKTQQAKLRFLQADHATSINVEVKTGPKGTSPAQEAKAGHAPTGLVGRKETNAKAAAVGGAGNLKQGDDETNKAKASAAAFISKKLAEENNNNNNKPSWTNVALKKTNKAEPRVEAPSRDAGLVKGRVKLKADPSILADLQPPDKPARDRGGWKPPGASPAASGSELPADWRSKLKPVARDAKPVGPSQPLKPWADKTPALPVSPIASSVPPAPKGLQNGNKERTGPRSNAAKAKPDYISKEDMMKELREIEDNLNELEKRGVELEMRLRKSEEEGDDDSLTDELMVEWFGLIRNKQLAVRRESELNYIGRTQELEEEQPSVEQELRRLMDKPEHLKTTRDQKREEQLMNKLMEIVNDRNAIVEGLDEDRLREEEEDEQLNKLMMDFNIKKDKAKRKSPMAKLFGWGNKKEA